MPAAPPRPRKEPPMLSIEHVEALQDAFGARLVYSSAREIWIDGIDVSDVARLATDEGDTALEYGALTPEELVILAGERAEQGLAEIAEHDRLVQLAVERAKEGDEAPGYALGDGAVN